MSGKALSGRRGKAGVTAAERVTLGVSILLLIVLVGGLVYLDVQRGDKPPRIVVEPDFEGAAEHEGDWYLPVTLRNEGDRTTDLLRVDLVRPVANQEPEVAELHYTFVAGGAEVEGIAVFDERPTSQTIEVDVVSVTEP